MFAVLIINSIDALNIKLKSLHVIYIKSLYVLYTYIYIWIVADLALDY